jgi:DNA-binding CsgD family transcriptional regulator
LSRWLRLQVGDFGATDIPSPRAPLSVERPMGRLVVQLLVEADHYVLVIERQSTVQGIANECALQLGLSPREGQVLAWLTRGKTNAEIAVILGSSARTVEKHVEHIFVKLGVETRTAAARIAFEQL